MAMIALRPVGSSWQKTTCSWPVPRVNTPSGSPGEVTSVPVTVVTFPFGPARVCGHLACWFGPAGMVREHLGSAYEERTPHATWVSTVKTGVVRTAARYPSEMTRRPPVVAHMNHCRYLRHSLLSRVSGCSGRDQVRSGPRVGTNSEGGSHEHATA